MDAGGLGGCGHGVHELHVPGLSCGEARSHA